MTAPYRRFGEYVPSECDRWNQGEPRLKDEVVDALETMIQKGAKWIADAVNALIEEDAIQIFGSLENAKRNAGRIECVYQKAPNDRLGMAQYRGIRVRGVWRIDHFPDWPMRDGPLEDDE